MGADSEVDMRSIVEGAWNEAESSDTGNVIEGNTVDGSGSHGITVSGDAASSVQDAGAQGRVDDSSAAPTTPDVAPGRSRDAHGRFAKGTEAQAKTQAPKNGALTQTTETTAKAPIGEPPSSSGPPVPATTTPTHRAPQSWSPAEREHFAKAPPEVQAAIARVDMEVRKVMQESAPARKFQQEFHQAMAPFEPMLRAAGLDPIRGATSAFQTIQQLQGPMAQRAQAIAGLIRNYGVDVAALATELDNPQQPQVDPRTIAQQVEAAVIQRFEQGRHQRATEAATREIESFAADPANEFFEDVYNEIAGIMDAAKARGVPMTLQDAYARATWANPEIRAILQKRAQAEAAKAATASTQQARIAASQVKSTPSTGASELRTPKSTRDVVEMAWDSLDGRR